MKLLLALDFLSTQHIDINIRHKPLYDRLSIVLLEPILVDEVTRRLHLGGQGAVDPVDVPRDHLLPLFLSALRISLGVDLRKIELQ